MCPLSHTLRISYFKRQWCVVNQLLSILYMPERSDKILRFFSHIGKKGEMKRVSEYNDTFLENGTKKCKFEYSHTALMHSTVVGDRTKVLSLLSNRKGRSVDFTLPLFRFTPLSEATRRGFTDIAKALIQHGANVNLPSEEDQSTPIMNAISNEDIHTARLLLRHGSKTHSWFLTFTRCPKMVRLLLSYGTKIESSILDVSSAMVLRLVKTGLESLKRNQRLSKSFMSKIMSEIEVSVLREIAFAISIRVPGCYGYATFYLIRDFMTFYGMFLADRYMIKNDKGGCAWQ